MLKVRVMSNDCRREDFVPYFLHEVTRGLGGLPEFREDLVKQVVENTPDPLLDEGWGQRFTGQPGAKYGY